mmetsp:Transcript_12143/g.35750  ORF Transcript_12143/g.35750 Transcript_12143/m.35750 type:complete len:447 (-) Transcript_12143:242-1582(-)
MPTVLREATRLEGLLVLQPTAVEQRQNGGEAEEEGAEDLDLGCVALHRGRWRRRRRVEAGRRRHLADVAVLPANPRVRVGDVAPRLSLAVGVAAVVMAAQAGDRVVLRGSRVLLWRLVRPVLAREAAGGEPQGATVVRAVGRLVALGVLVEAVGSIEAARLDIARGIALAVADRRRKAEVGTRRLVFLEAVVLVPLARLAEAGLVAVVVADPLGLAVRGTDIYGGGAFFRPCLAVAAIKVARLHVALLVARPVAEAGPRAALCANRRLQLTVRALAVDDDGEGGVLVVGEDGEVKRARRLGARRAAEEVCVAPERPLLHAVRVGKEGVVSAGGEGVVEGDVQVGVAAGRHDDHAEPLHILGNRHLVERVRVLLHLARDDGVELDRRRGVLKRDGGEIVVVVLVESVPIFAVRGSVLAVALASGVDSALRHVGAVGGGVVGVVVGRA